MKRILPLLLLAIATPAFATWNVTSGLNADGTTTDNFYATDGTWDLKFQRGSNGAYSCRNNSGTGGEILDLTTFNDDMADAGIVWNAVQRYPVTVIGLSNEGFMNLTGLKEVRLPSTVTTFSNQCLKNTGLEGEFVMPDSITTMGDAVFQNCTALTRVVINEKVKTLSNTFFGCSALQEVKIASGTTTLSGSPFRACPSLTTVYANDEDRVVGSVVLPATVTVIPANCFYDDTSIERVVAPSVTTLSGERVFQNCKSLAEVVLPALQQFSNNYTFNGCILLRRLEVPCCVRLSQGTFFGCTALEEVCVSPALHTLGSDCFRDCTSFRTLYTNEATRVAGHVQIPATVTGNMGGYTFYRTKIERIDAPGITGITGERPFNNCTQLVEAHFPSLAAMTATDAFSGCSLLTVVEVSPNLAGSIGNCAFCYCYSLESVYQSGNEPVVGLMDLPAGVTTLGWGFCWQNRSLEHVVAPGVVSIDNRAFRACTALKTVRFSPNLAELKNNGGSSSDCAINECPALVDFYPSAMPKATQLYAGTFVNDSSLTNAFDFSGATLSDTGGAFLFSGCKKVPCVKLPASFPKLYSKEFYDMKPGAEIHFAGGVPPWTGDYPLYQGKNGAGNRYKIFVDAETYPGWTTSAGTFTPVTEAMKSESDYPGIATLGYINYASNNQNNWLVQEPFYVDVTFYDEDGTTVLDTVKTLLGTAPAWTNAAPTKASTAQFDYEFAGWSTNGTTIVDLADFQVEAPMSFRAVYTPSARSHTITWQWFDGTDTQSDATSVAYGDTPVHAAVERAATTEHTYTFQGWSTDGATVLDPIPDVTGPATYIAVFEEKDASTTVTVRWLDDNGTTVLATTWPDKGTVAEAPLVPSKESTISTTYAFAGWSADGSTVLADLTVSADTDFIAVYTPSVRKYTISFVNWDGAAIASADYDYETPAALISLPGNPTRDADAGNTYAFSAWVPEIADVTGDATYTATYTATPKAYAATFVDWDGTTLSGPTDYDVGADVVAPADPEREGHTFAGWSPEVSTMPAAATTYTATYTVNKYRLTFVNGDGVTTAKYDYGTPTNAISFPGGSKSSTSKFYYRFLEWMPEKEAVQSNTTYTARFSTFVAKPMTLALVDAVPGADPTAFSVTARLAGKTASAPDPSPDATAARFKPHGSVDTPFGGVASLDGVTVSASYSNLDVGRGYNWEIVVTQEVVVGEAVDRAVLRGRSYAKRHTTWFSDSDVEWTEGGFAPQLASEEAQQVRVLAAFAVPEVAPAALPDASGQVTGIGIKSIGAVPSWYGWNGSKWVRLVGADPTCGNSVQVLTVVDFAARTPTATWYADGLPLTTEDGEWAVPLETSARRLQSFYATATVNSLSADYDLGNRGFLLYVR